MKRINRINNLRELATEQRREQMESYTDTETSILSLKLFPFLDVPTAWIHCQTSLVVVK